MERLKEASIETFGEEKRVKSAYKFTIHSHLSVSTTLPNYFMLIFSFVFQSLFLTF